MKRKEESIAAWARRTGAADRIRDLYQPTQPAGQAPAGSPPDINYKLHYVWPHASRHLGLTPPPDTQLPPPPQGPDMLEYDPADRPWDRPWRVGNDPWDHDDPGDLGGWEDSEGVVHHSDEDLEW